MIEVWSSTVLRGLYGLSIFPEGVTIRCDYDGCPKYVTTTEVKWNHEEWNPAGKNVEGWSIREDDDGEKDYCPFHARMIAEQ